jgi:eukaryotic-like serine/threonine-protein kinase
MEESESKDMLRKMLKRSFGAIKPIGEHRYSPDEEVCRIIEKMMKIDLAARYQNMDDVVADLDRHEASLKPPETTSAETMGREAVAEGNESFFAEIEGLEAGDGERAEPEEKLEHFEVKVLVAKTVLCVESQSEIQDALRKSVTNWGYRALLVADAELGAERFREAKVDAVIFDTDGQGAESVEAFLDMHEKAHEEGQKLRAVVLLGPRQEALRERLPTDDKLIVLSKPIKMKQVQAALARLLPAR